MRWDAFCGPSSTALAQDVQRAVNLFCERADTSGKNERYALVGTPGRSLFATLAGGGVRALHTEPGQGADRCFAIGGSKLYELASDGTATLRGDVSTDGQPAKIASNTVDGGTQLFIASDRKGFLYVLTTDALTGPIANVDPLSVVALSTYFVALTSLGIQWSDPLDGATWDPLDFNGPGGIALLADRKELWVYRSRNIEVYTATSEETVFQPTPSGFIQQGLLAPESIAQIDNAQFHLGGDERGHGIVWSSEGYAPRRISTHAVEQALQGFGLTVLAGARGYAYQEGGHSFYVLNFPGAPNGSGAWAYDTTTGLWHERARWANGQYTAEHGCLHTFAFGRHLVGDPITGKIYEQSMGLYDDDGDVIRRLRRSPRLVNELRRQPLSTIQVDLEAGLGLSSGQGADPQIALRLSGDGGKTFGNERLVNVGKIGEYSRRALSYRWGAPRDLVLELTATDPVPWRIANVYLNPES